MKIIGFRQNVKLSSRVKKTVLENIGENEELLFCLVGGNDQTLVALDRRLIVIKPGFMAGSTFGARVTSFLYKDITSINTQINLISGFLEVSTPDFQTSKNKSFWTQAKDEDIFKIPNIIPITKRHLKSFQPYLAQIIEMVKEQKKVDSPIQDDFVSQLNKLSKLHETGVLTDEEFLKAKKKLIE